MPFGGGKTSTVNVSGLTWDADLIVPAARKVTTDHLAETTGGHGIVHDNKIAADHVGEVTGAHGVVVDNVLKSDHVAEVTGAHGVVVDNVLKSDHVAEVTGAHGVVIDSLLAPAAGATLAAGQVLKADHVGETTGAHGVVVDNVLKSDHVAEVTGAHGVVIDSLLAPAAGATLAAGQVLKADHVGETTGAHGIVLNNTETGQQTGSGNSAAGALLACQAASFVGSVASTKVTTVIRRAGTYSVKVFNELALAGGGRTNLDVNGANVWAGGMNAAAQTETACGDIVLAAGDRVTTYQDIAATANQSLAIRFYNSDGMWT